jgi:hypothetical protein
VPDSPYPGVFVEEVPEGPPPIAAAPTSVTAFVGPTRRGSIRRPIRCDSWAGFERACGGHWAGSDLGHAVTHYFDNGGRTALIARVVGGSGSGARGTTGASATAGASEAAGSDGVGGGRPSSRAYRAAFERLADDGVGPVNLVVVPPPLPGADVPRDVWLLAADWCREHRAMLVVDPPASWTTATAATRDGLDGVPGPDTALYFPRLLAPDPLAGGAVRPFAPGGAVAGVIARTDLARGVWKAPAGMEAMIRGAVGLEHELRNADIGALTPEAVNPLRSLPTGDHVVWGARTGAGEDRLGSEWKYVTVRRTALFLERSLCDGLQWVVFEPNGEPLWGRIRSSVSAFLDGLFRVGAFVGSAPREAYFVRCDATTTTQRDVDAGFVNVLIGFAPLTPAEFVVVRVSVQAASTGA